MASFPWLYILLPTTIRPRKRVTFAEPSLAGRSQTVDSETDRAQTADSTRDEEEHVEPEEPAGHGEERGKRRCAPDDDDEINDYAEGDLDDDVDSRDGTVLEEEGNGDDAEIACHIDMARARSAALSPEEEASGGEEEFHAPGLRGDAMEIDDS